jgi:hypothetical protein
MVVVTNWRRLRGPKAPKIQEVTISDMDPPKVREIRKRMAGQTVRNKNMKVTLPKVGKDET